MSKQTDTGHFVGLVRLRKIGRFWYARYTTPQGRIEKSLKVTNLRIAERKAREINDLLENGQYQMIDARKTGQSLTFSDFMEQFRQNYMNWGETTWRGNESRLQILIVEFGTEPLTAITPQRIESFLARRREQNGNTVATANRYLATLKTILKMAVRWGYLVVNPADSIKLSREQSRVPEALHYEELERLLAELPPHIRLLATFAAETGMRVSEMKRLMWNDVDLKRREIAVRESKNDDCRRIPMSDKVYQIIVDLMQDNPDPQIRSLHVLKMVDMREHLDKAAGKVGLGHVHPHMFRHTFATILLDRAVPINDVQYLMGHKTPIMTQRYDHGRDERYQAAIEALNS